jgi:hypothetical protein
MSCKEEAINRLEALAYLLVKEKLRHAKDINGIEQDLAKLKAKGIKIPKEENVDCNEWWDA